jgi:urea transport system ATP-binding protein
MAENIVLSLIDVTKSYNSFAVVDQFSMAVHEGELRCLLGPNGAGKTTTIDLITGRQHLTSGRVIFQDKDISDIGEHRIVRSGIGRKFQVPAVFRDLTVRENLEVASRIHTSPFGNAFLFRRRCDPAKFRDVVEMSGLGDRLEAKAGHLSHGEIQWLELGMVLTQNPRLLLMDEPTAGMTEQETIKTSQIFSALKGSHTLIVVEHDMSFVRLIADVVTIMHMGRRLFEGTMVEAERDLKVREVYLGSEGAASVH